MPANWRRQTRFPFPRTLCLGFIVGSPTTRFTWQLVYERWLQQYHTLLLTPSSITTIPGCAVNATHCWFLVACRTAGGHTAPSRWTRPLLPHTYSSTPQDTRPFARVLLKPWTEHTLAVTTHHMITRYGCTCLNIRPHWRFPLRLHALPIHLRQFWVAAPVYRWALPCRSGLLLARYWFPNHTTLDTRWNACPHGPGFYRSTRFPVLVAMIPFAAPHCSTDVRGRAVTTYAVSAVSPAFVY